MAFTNVGWDAPISTKLPIKARHCENLAIYSFKQVQCLVCRQTVQYLFNFTVGMGDALIYFLVTENLGELDQQVSELSIIRHFKS